MKVLSPSDHLSTPNNLKTKLHYQKNCLGFEIGLWCHFRHENQNFWFRWIWIELELLDIK